MGQWRHGPQDCDLTEISQGKEDFASEHPSVIVKADRCDGWRLGYGLGVMGRLAPRYSGQLSGLYGTARPPTFGCGFGVPVRCLS